MKNLICLLISLCSIQLAQATVVNIGNSGRAFNPSSVTVKLGDTINFSIGSFHNAVEVNKATWDTNDTVGLAGGFRLPLGGGMVVMNKVGTIYYVCTPHVNSDKMKGAITVFDPTAVPKPVLHTVSGTQDRRYSPSILTVNLGDTINFRTFNAHDAVEVTKATWDANDTMGLTGGFRVPLSGGIVIMNKLGPIYFICTPHVKSHQMKGIVTVIAPSAIVPVNLVVVKNDSAKTKFEPAVINVAKGDTVHFELAADVNAQEISKTVYDNNGSTWNGGFLTNNGGGKVVMNRTGTLYYTSEKYSLFGMKGIINVKERGDLYVAKISGVQEEFPFAGMGSGLVNLRHDGDTLYVEGSFKNLTGDYSNSHIHRGFAGISGGVQIALSPIVDSTKKSGTFNSKLFLNAAQKDMLKSRELYFNVHSSVMPGGEIRGQVLPESDAYYQANIFGSQENPSIMSRANGAIVAELKGSDLIITGSAKTLQSGYTSSHVHLGYPGQNGGVQIALKPSIIDSANIQFRPLDNAYTLTPNQLASLKAGQLYINIHSRTWPGGEIRGQILPMATAKFRAYLSGAYELVPILTQASGAMIGNLVDSTLTIVGSFNGLESNWNGGAHLHKGMAGQNGGVQIGLKAIATMDNRGGTFVADSNTYKLSGANLDDLFSRRLYSNIHSTSNTGGEIRGQMLPESQFVMVGTMTGMQENRPVLSTGRGGAVLEVNGPTVTLSGHAERLIGKIISTNGAHVHRGAVGQNGGVVRLLNYTFPTSDSMSIIFPAASNTYTVSTGMLDTIRRRLTYVNVHTAQVGSGEIRAQLNHEASAVFHTILSGAGETVPVNSKATGGLMSELSGKNLITHGSFGNLNTKWNGGAHIHGGLPGTNGGVKFNITPTMNVDSLAGIISAVDNVQALSDGNIDSLRKRQLYANIHTSSSPGGEIRGTLHGISQAILNANLSSLNEVPSFIGSGNGGIKAEILDSKMAVVGSFSNLVGEFNGGAHFHNGANGVNGGVAIALKAIASADKKSGQFVVDSNQYNLTNDQILSILGGNMYANIHSSTNTGGEIRGQLLLDPNNFPNASTITSPKQGDTVKINLAKDSVLTTTWAAATDPDGNSVVYKVQNALLPDFGLILTNTLVGNVTTLSLRAKSVDSVFAAPPFSIPAGGTITVPSRIVVSDGSLNTVGTPTLVVFQRAIITAVLDEFVKSYSMILYPVPAHQFAILEINAKKAGNMEMRVIDLSGKINHQQKLSLVQGLNRVTLDISKYNTGTHFVQMIQNGQNVAYFKMQKQ